MGHPEGSATEAAPEHRSPPQQGWDLEEAVAARAVEPTPVGLEQELFLVRREAETRACGERLQW